MNQNILSRSACNALRGIAIIGIFLHNYCHWLGPIVKENEYQFFQHNADWLLQVMANPDINLLRCTTFRAGSNPGVSAGANLCASSAIII